MNCWVSEKVHRPHGMKLFGPSCKFSKFDTFIYLFVWNIMFIPCSRVHSCIEWESEIRSRVVTGEACRYTCDWTTKGPGLHRNATRWGYGCFTEETSVRNADLPVCHCLQRPQATEIIILSISANPCQDFFVDFYHAKCAQFHTNQCVALR